MTDIDEYFQSAISNAKKRGLEIFVERGNETFWGGNEYHYYDNGRGRIRCWINGRRVTQRAFQRRLSKMHETNPPQTKAAAR